MTSPLTYDEIVTAAARIAGIAVHTPLLRSDALDAATREPATKGELLEAKAELKADIAEVRADIGLLRQRIDQIERNIDAKIDTSNDKLTVRLGGIGLALDGALFAALRFTTP